MRWLIEEHISTTGTDGLLIRDINFINVDTSTYAFGYNSYSRLPEPMEYGFTASLGDMIMEFEEDDTLCLIHYNQKFSFFSGDGKDGYIKLKKTVPLTIYYDNMLGEAYFYGDEEA